jgi:excinuclease UvrABC ATPase subunit
MRDIISYVSEFDDGSKFYLSCPFLRTKSDLTVEKIKKEVLDAGFIRFLINGQEYNVNADFELPETKLEIEIIVDRLVVKDFSDNESPDTKRFKDSIAVAYKNGDGQMSVNIL